MFCNAMGKAAQIYPITLLIAKSIVQNGSRQDENEIVRDSIDFIGQGCQDRYGRSDGTNTSV